MTVLEYLTIRTFDRFSLPLVTVLLLFCLVDTVSIVVVAVSVSIVAAFDVAVDGTSAVDPTTIDAVAALLLLRSVRDNDAIVLSTEVSVELSLLAIAAIVAVAVVVVCSRLVFCGCCDDDGIVGCESIRFSVGIIE